MRTRERRREPPRGVTTIEALLTSLAESWLDMVEATAARAESTSRSRRWLDRARRTARRSLDDLDRWAADQSEVQ